MATNLGNVKLAYAHMRHRIVNLRGESLRMNTAQILDELDAIRIEARDLQLDTLVDLVHALEQVLANGRGMVLADRYFEAMEYAIGADAGDLSTRQAIFASLALDAA